MKRLFIAVCRRGLTHRAVALCFFTMLWCCANSALAVTVPVMVDYFDTANFGAQSPDGITHIPTTCFFAIIDDEDDMVYIVDRAGIVQNQFTVAPYSNYATDIAYIPEGPYAEHFAITDRSARKVFIVASTGGSPVHEFSTAAFGSNSPYGITYVASGPRAGNLAIVDPTTDFVYFVDFAGNLHGSFPIGPDGCTNPYGITFMPGTEYVAIIDYSLNDVFLFDQSGNLQDRFDVGFVSSSSYGIVYDACNEDWAVVSDGQDEVFFFDIHGNVVKTINLFDLGSASPMGVAYDPSQKVYAIIDNAGAEVFFVDPESEALVAQCDISAFSPSAKGITYGPGAGNFSIVDDNKDAIFTIDSSCTLLAQFGISTFGIGATSPNGIAYIPGSGYLAVVDTSKRAAMMVDLSRPGRIVDQFSTHVFGSTSPSGILHIPVTGNFAVSDNSLGDVFVVSPKGVLSARFDTTPFFTTPQGIALDNDTNTFGLVDNTKDELKILDLPCLLKPPPSSCECDLNNDGVCNMDDWLIFGSNWGRTDCPLQ
jgi:DNA-binding beta-propeller fold protein YncE